MRLTPPGQTIWPGWLDQDLMEDSEVKFAKSPGGITDRISVFEALPATPLKNCLDLTRLAELDRQFCEFAKLQRDGAPGCGWAKTVRLALGMSSRALGARVGVSPWA